MEALMGGKRVEEEESNHKVETVSLRFNKRQTVAAVITC